MSDCKRSCCWTPYVCATRGLCACHQTPEARKEAALETLRNQQATLRHQAHLAGNRNPDNEGNPR